MEGPFIGNGYVSGIGTVKIFGTDKPEFFRVQNRSGQRYFTARGRVQFRKSVTKTKETIS
jgi:hypothetical protein